MNEAAMFALDDAARRRRAALIFHENAHQWFGNLATMRWFDDLWLKEGFANLLAARQLDRLTGWSGRQFLADLATNIHGAPPLRPALSNLDHAWTVYNAVPYGRGPAVLDALAARLGAVRFRRLVRALVARYAKSNFASDDLIDCVRTTAGGTASRWLATRIAGRPADARGARLAAKSPLRSAPTPDEPALARLLAHASRPSRHAKAAVLATLLRRPTLPDRWLDTCLPPLFAPEHTTITIELIPVAVALLSERVATCPLFTIDRWLAVLIAGAATAPAQRALRNAARQLPRGAELRHKILATKVTS